MSSEIKLGIACIVIGIAGIVITTVIAICAMLDVRNQVKKIIKIGRDLAYLRVKNDLVWEFIDPTESAYTVQIANSLHEFGFLAQALDPNQTADTIRGVVEKESLEFAEELVNNGRATWKKGLSLEKARGQITIWRAEKNVERAKRILDEK